MKLYFSWLAQGMVLIFALIGLLLTAGFIGVKYGWTNVAGVAELPSATTRTVLTERAVFPWAQGPEWAALESAIIKDSELINRASAITDVSARIIVATLVPEQLRLYTSERELFKSFFGPLQVLGNQTQFSWGVMGFKPDTARAVEVHLKNPVSPFYPGAQYEHLLDFSTENAGAERFVRIANEDDHYYSYLYAALYLRQIIAQGKPDCYDLTVRPDVLATLFNIGFGSSRPNAEPKAGGAPIEINGEMISFGRLAYEFYYSQELIEYFPR